MALPQKKRTTLALWRMREMNEKIVVMTAYDATQAATVEAAGVDAILVGDSVGMVMLGYDTTIPVTLHDMIHHARAVRRGAGQTMMIVDLPFATYHGSQDSTLDHAAALMRDAFADAVKLEGGRAQADHVRTLVRAGIPVCGHIGLTPQSVFQFGGFRVQGRGEDAARTLLDDVQALADAGAFAVVLECIPAPLALQITQAVPIPTIGIGAGPDCSGQVLVYHDVLGLRAGRSPKFVKQYADLRALSVAAIAAYGEEVRNGVFPSAQYSYDVEGQSGGDAP